MPIPRFLNFWKSRGYRLYFYKLFWFSCSLSTTYNIKIFCSVFAVWFKVSFFSWRLHLKLEYKKYSLHPIRKYQNTFAVVAPLSINNLFTNYNSVTPTTRTSSNLFPLCPQLILLVNPCVNCSNWNHVIPKHVRISSIRTQSKYEYEIFGGKL